MSASTPKVLVLRADWHEPSWRAQAAREKLRALTRIALARLAEELGAPQGPFEKDGSGAPLPLGDWRWSVSHASGFAVAALSPARRIGVDVEAAGRVPSEHTRARLAELGAVAADDASWLAAWCRVEAALKATGRGLGGLSAVRIDGDLVTVDDETLMTRTFEIEGALVAIAGGGVCAAEPPRFELATEVAA